MSVELTITLPDFDDPAHAANYLRQSLKTLQQENKDGQNLEVSIPGLMHQHDDWDWGNCCPECGADNLCIGEITYSEQYATGDDIEHGKPLDFHGGVVSITCNNTECLADLYVTPSSYLANH